MTLTFQLLADPTGTTSGAWVSDATMGTAGVITVTSGTTQPFSWLPPTPDYRILVTNSGAGLTALKSTLLLATDRAAGT